MNNSKIEKIFQVLAVILIGVAAYFLWRGSNDGLFVAGVLGAVCFFLSIRFQVKERMEQREFEKWEAEEEIIEETSETEENLKLTSPIGAFSAQEIIESEKQASDHRKAATDN